MSNTLNIKLTTGGASQAPEQSTSYEWGNITGDITLQTDLVDFIQEKVQGDTTATEEKLESLKAEVQDIINEVKNDIPTDYVTSLDLNNYTENINSTLTEKVNKEEIDEIISDYKAKDAILSERINTLETSSKKYTDDEIKDLKDKHDTEVEGLNQALNKTNDQLKNTSTYTIGLNTKIDDNLERAKAYTDLRIKDVNNSDDIITEVEVYVDGLFSESKAEIKSEVVKELDITNKINTKVESYFQDLSDKIDNIEIPETDLTGYAKLTDIPDHSNYALKTDIPTDYATVSLLNSYALKTDIPEVDLTEYAKMSDIPTDYVKAEDIEDITKTLENVDRQVINNTKQIELLRSHNDTQDREHEVLEILIDANKAYMFSVNSSVNKHFNDVSTKLNDHVDKVGEALKSYVDVRIGELEEEHESVTSTLERYVDHTIEQYINDIAYEHIPNILGAEYYTKVDIDTLLNKDYVYKNDLTKYAKLTDLPVLPNFSEFALKKDIPTDHLTYADLRDYAKKSDLPTMQGFLKEEDLEGYAKLTDIPAPQDLTSYVTKEYLNNKLKDVSVEIDLDGYVKEETLDNYQPKGDYLTSLDLSIYALKTDIPTGSGCECTPGEGGSYDGIKVIETSIGEYYAKKTLGLLQDGVLYAAPGESCWVSRKDYDKLRDGLEKLWKEFVKIKDQDRSYVIIDAKDYENLVQAGKIITGVRYVIIQDGYETTVVN